MMAYRAFWNSPIYYLSTLLCFVFVIPDTAAHDISSDSNTSIPFPKVWASDDRNDNETVSFHFGDNTFKVPKNYLVGGSDVPRPNEPGYFMIDALLPDLAPHTVENDSQFSPPLTGHGFGAVISITVHYKMNIQPPQDTLNLILSLDKKDVRDFQITTSGYKLYRIITGIREDIYLNYDKEPDGLFIMRCSPEIDFSPHKMCMAYRQFMKDIAYQYYFDKSFADIGYEIDGRLRHLLDSFRHAAG